MGDVLARWGANLHSLTSIHGFRRGRQTEKLMIARINTKHAVAVWLLPAVRKLVPLWILRLSGILWAYYPIAPGSGKHREGLGPQIKASSRGSILCFSQPALQAAPVFRIKNSSGYSAWLWGEMEPIISAEFGRGSTMLESHVLRCALTAINGTDCRVVVLRRAAVYVLIRNEFAEIAEW